SSAPKPAPQAQQEPSASERPATAAQPAPDSSFRARPPAPGKPVEFRAPIPAQLTLSNGLRVYLIERHEVPLVTVALAVRSGADGPAPLGPRALGARRAGGPATGPQWRGGRRIPARVMGRARPGPLPACR